MPGTISFLKQSFPGTPTFTEKDVPDLQGKVCSILTLSISKAINADVKL